MSFQALVSSDVTLKKKELVIKVGEKEYKFFANEISFLQRLNIAAAQSAGGDPFTLLVINSITDENGQRMTEEQAKALPPEYALQLFEAAAEVNKQEKSEKN